MGRPESEKASSSAGRVAAGSVGWQRRRLVRALLSALAGGGLTAAGLGGAAAQSALAAGPRASAEGLPSGGSVQATGSEGTGTGTTGASETSTTPTTTSTTPTTTSTTPSPSTTTPQTTTTPQSTPAPKHKAGVEAPSVVVKRKQKSSAGAKARSEQANAANAKAAAEKAGPNGVAASPQSVADTAALEAILNSSNASAAALNFYRVPLFLLPIYKAAAVQYGVPWQILAAINEIETDYGTDLSVSSAGAVGWMQFMPGTWLQYGVDALDAGYADPYNPVDAIFAAARYLRAAGAASNLKDAILAYNHSEEYVSSVLLRAKLITTYPKGIVATLTGLIDGRLPVTGKQLSWTTPDGSSSSSPNGSSSATAGATQTSAGTPATPAGSTTAATAQASTPGSTAPPTPAAAAAGTGSGHPLQLASLSTSPKASVVAVQDGRVIGLGASRKLGLYVILRDVYGDVFTYSGLGAIAPTYTTPKTPAAASSTAVAAAASAAPAPKGPASAGTQPQTLKVSAPKPSSSPSSANSGKVTITPVAAAGVPAGMGRARLYAHPDNPDARAAVAAKAAERASQARATTHIPLRKGSVVAAGTVLGKVTVDPEAKAGSLRFAVQPAGDSATIDPGAVLSNWAQLQAALHPEGAKASNPLLGATASDVLLLSRSQLQRAVLSDPEISIYGCGRRDISGGLVDRRTLAVIAFLARSGLEPTISALRCGQSEYTAGGALSAAFDGRQVDISAINGVKIAHHQGPGTITDLTIRTLLTLPQQFVPHEILSLMRYPQSSNTQANSTYWNHIQLVFSSSQPAAQAAAAQAHGSGAAQPATTNLGGGSLNTSQWEALMGRIQALPFPAVPTKPSSSAIPDPRRPH